jgi:hypothetical protein
MRPKIATWSVYGAPRHKHWRSPARRSSRSIGPKILVAAVVVVAGVIGLNGIYPQLIDSEWLQERSSRSQPAAHTETAPAPRRSGIAAEIPLPPRRTPVTTGVDVTPVPAPTPALTPPPATPPAPALRALATAPTSAEPAPAAMPAPAPASAPVLQQMPPSVAAIEPNETVQPRADNQDVLTVADPPTEPAPTASAVVKPAQRYVVRPSIEKKRVVRAEHHRNYSRAYAQYGSSWGGGWGGWSGMGSPYHF